MFFEKYSVYVSRKACSKKGASVR